MSEQGTTVDNMNEMFGISQMLREGREERSRLEKIIYDSQIAADCVIRQTHELPQAIEELKQRALAAKSQLAAEQTRVQELQRDSERLSAIECFALGFASKYHAGQVDKAGCCYLAHAIRVALSVRRTDPHYFITGILHDVVEDTPCTLDLIRDTFGSEVMDAVASVTRRKDGNSKENYREYVSRAVRHPIGLVVKRADVLDNLRPERIGALDKRTQERLKEKYKVAIEAIDAAPQPRAILNLRAKE